MTLWFDSSIRAIWEAAKWNGIHPAFLMENPKSIDVSLWSRQGPGAPSCGWRVYPNNPGQIACFSAAQLLTCFLFFHRKRRKNSGVETCRMRKRRKCIGRSVFMLVGKARRGKKSCFTRQNQQKRRSLLSLSQKKNYQPPFKFVTSASETWTRHSINYLDSKTEKCFPSDESPSLIQLGSKEEEKPWSGPRMVDHNRVFVLVLWSYGALVSSEWKNKTSDALLLEHGLKHDVNRLLVTLVPILLVSQLASSQC